MEFGDYADAKVYFDGGHYIAIPYRPNPFASKKKYKKKEILCQRGASNAH